MTTFSYTGTFVTYTVQRTGVYDIVAYGAQGSGDGTSFGGKGAEIGGDVTLTTGEKLTIAVGGAGKYGGGGGGSFVVVPGSTPTPLVIAGGGGVSVEPAAYTVWSPNGQIGPSGSGSLFSYNGYGSNGRGGSYGFQTGEGGGGGFFTGGQGEPGGGGGASYLEDLMGAQTVAVSAAAGAAGTAAAAATAGASALVNSAPMSNNTPAAAAARSTRAQTRFWFPARTAATAWWSSRRLR